LGIYDLNVKKLIWLNCLLINLEGCALLASTAGGSAATIQIAQTIDIMKTAGDIGSASVTGKTLTDHALSELSGKNCKTLNIVEDKKLCEEAEAKIQSVKVRQVVMPDVSTPKKIKAFQKSKNLEQTGKIGPKTRLALWRIKHGIDD
jgi:peptidoglycan hydrolase-like protein with peptidoglycan-binding domain